MGFPDSRPWPLLAHGSIVMIDSCEPAFTGGHLSAVKKAGFGLQVLQKNHEAGAPKTATVTRST
jgi:hypothetical protein